MSAYYTRNDRLYVAVDCVIFGLDHGRLCLLLTKRSFEPEAGKWSLMGGFVGRDESVDDAAARVLHDLTGIADVYMHQVGTFGAVDRDPGERVISVAYSALVNIADVDSAAVAEHEAHWLPLDELPELGFDHPMMIERALAALRRKFAVEPVAFRLLPPLFTLSQLQALYETVLGEEIDKRNFRKRVAEVESVVATDCIDKTGSRRGARLYRFDNNIYEQNLRFKI
ncbi:MAG: NUDIX hydrolase [Muribaculaceae bacterium]|nr:NUDIX hydrolase [Muribaculaceae bacterium]MDE6565319.1 NUDIX hydrolase [Muribaculaceae bacterium]